MHLLIIDTETGGLEPGSDALLEIGALLVNGRLEQTGSFEALVQPWPGLGLQAEALAVNGLDPAVVQAAGREEHTVLRSLLEFLSDPLAQGPVILAGWNVSFDQAFLKAAFRRHSLEWPFGHRSFDIQSVWAICHDWDFGGLTNACQLLFGTLPGHRALADATVELEVLRRCRGSISALEP